MMVDGQLNYTPDGK